MNINEKYLYEEFININLKYRYLIFDFIDKYCPIAPKKKKHALYKKIKHFKPRDQNDLKKRKARILKDLKLQDYRKITVYKKCKSCELCKYETISIVKKMLSEMLGNILLEKIPAEKVVNDFIKEFGSFDFKLIEDCRGEFTLQKGDTLRQMIFFNFIENIPDELNAFFGKQNKYFKQIAKLLLVNNDFLDYLGNIRDKYFKPKDYEGYTISYFPQVKNTVFLHFNIRQPV